MTSPQDPLRTAIEALRPTPAKWHTEKDWAAAQDWTIGAVLTVVDRLVPPRQDEPGLREALRPIVADWFDTGYENGKLDPDVLTDCVLAALRAAPAEPQPAPGARRTTVSPCPDCAHARGLHGGPCSFLVALPTAQTCGCPRPWEDWQIGALIPAESQPAVDREAALDDADARIRAAQPPPRATDEFKAGWHKAVSAGLTAVARVRYYSRLAALPAATEPADDPINPNAVDNGLVPTLDEAWKAAEEALPEGWRISTLMIEWNDNGWVVEAEPLDPNGPPVVQAVGPTPAAALHNLAAALANKP